MEIFFKEKIYFYLCIYVLGEYPGKAGKGIQPPGAGGGAVGQLCSSGCWAPI